MTKFYIAIVLLALSFPGAAQSKPAPNASIGGQGLRIKGHVIGETGAEFLKAEPQVQKDLNECHADPKGQNVYISEEAYRSICGSEINALENNGDGTIQISGEDVGDVAEWRFEGGLLTVVSISLCCEYHAIRDDLSKRIGATPSESKSVYQNGFGARWAARTAVWMTRKYHAKLFENNDPTSEDRYSVVTIETRKSYDAAQIKEKNKPSPLD